MKEILKKAGSFYEKAVISLARRSVNLLPKEAFIFLIAIKKFFTPGRNSIPWFIASLRMKNLKSQDREYYRRIKNENYGKYTDSSVKAVLYAAAGPEYRICDFGCGEGDLVYALRKAGFNCLGFENSKTILSSKNSEYIFDVSSFFNSGKKFDIVCLFSVLEHIEKDDINSFVGKIAAFSKDWIICSIPLYPDNLPVFYDDPTHRIFEEESFWNRIFMSHGFYRAYGPPERLPFVNLLIYRRRKSKISEIWNLNGSNIVRTRMSIGDNLCFLPVLKKIKERYPEISFYLSNDSSYTDMLLSSGLFAGEPREPLPGENIAEFHFARNLSIHLKQEFAAQAGLLEKDLPAPEIFPSQKDKIDFEKRGPCLAVDIRSGWKSRVWPVENFEKVCALLKKKFKVQIIEVGKNSWSGAAKSVSGKLKTADISFVDKLTITQTAWVIRECGFFLGNDSGLAHLAAAVKAKSFVIYGPAEASLRAHGDMTVPFYDEECYGCYTKGIYGEKKLKLGCPRIHHKCMRKVKPEIVAARIAFVMGLKNGT